MKRSIVLSLLLAAIPVFAEGPGPSLVTVYGRQLIVQMRHADGTLAAPVPWIIRGSVWSPASTTTNTNKNDPNNAAVRRLEFAPWVENDTALLAAMNVNTVRLMIDPGPDSGGRAVLDRLYADGIMVVMTVDNGVNDLTRVQQVVQYYKDHPAILMWNLGSEWNINRYFGAATTVQDAAQRTENAAALIKSLDTAHPVATSYGEIDINASGMHLADTTHYVRDVCPHVDVWGLNIYRGNSVGTLFSQWAGITGKPMFFGEFGTDAFRSVTGSTSAGSVDGILQSDWDAVLWNELFGHLSANTPEAVSLGAFVFEHNDEWWKVSPPTSQETGGFSGAHPDGFFNEEYFGVFDINRNPRPVRDTLATAFDEPYQPPQTHTYRVISRGANAEEYGFQYGTAWIVLDGAKLYSANGGGGGGRGFNVAIFDPATGVLQQPVQHFDTWADGNAFCAMNTLLDAVSNGMLILMGVADEAGLGSSNSCRTDFVQRVTILGSQKIGQYCFRGSWAFAAVKGEGVARAEEVSCNGEASARTTLPVPTRTLSLSMTPDGIVRSVPAGVQCSASCNVQLPLNGTFTLHAVASQGWQLLSWGGDCSGSTDLHCDLTLSANRNVTATFGPPVPASFYSITPCRILDTRASAALVSGNVRTVPVTGACNVPATAKAVALNVTVVAPTAAGWLSLYPSGILRPNVSTHNFRTGKTRANNALVTLSPSGKVDVYNGSLATTNFIIDVSGYFQ